MRALAFCLVFASSFAHADSAAGRVFSANNHAGLVGRNAISGSVCSLRAYETSLKYHFSKDISAAPDEAAALNLGANAISAGHFGKALLRSRLVHKYGGAFDLSCVLMGRCTKGKIVIEYGKHDQITRMSETYDGKLVDDCVIARAR